MSLEKWSKNNGMFYRLENIIINPLLCIKIWPTRKTISPKTSQFQKTILSANMD